MSKIHEEILERSEALMRLLAPKSCQMDWDITSLREAFDALAAAGFLGLKRSEKYGGPAMPEPLFRKFQVAIARGSGALAFLQTQHQSAVSLISKSENESLKDRYLPLMHGPRLVGIGFSQLRRPGKPLFTAERVEGGYLLNGNIPWATGFEFFPEILIGAALPEEQGVVFAVVPFIHLSGNQGTIEISERMGLAAMEACSTVAMNFTNWLVFDEQVVNILPSDWIHKNDELNITLQGFFALGCAWAGFDVIADILANNPNQPAIADFQNRLKVAIIDIESKLMDASFGSSDFDKSALRGQVIELAFKSSQGAIVASRGAGVSINHAAQRVYREAMVFAVSAQTASIQACTLETIQFSSN